MLPRYLLAELLKLRRSLALMLCVAAPLAVLLLVVLRMLDTAKPMSWMIYSTQVCMFWAFAMMPLTITALSVLLGQMEHGPRMWNHVMTLPGARPNVFIAKAAIMMALMAGMGLLLYALMYLGALVLHGLTPRHVADAWDPGQPAYLLAWGIAAMMLAAMLQLWVALRFRSFVPPLIFGIAGTFVSVTATGSEYGRWFPWLLATQMLASKAGEAERALAYGAGGGLLVMLLLVAHLSLREA